MTLFRARPGSDFAIMAQILVSIPQIWKSRMCQDFGRVALFPAAPAKIETSCMSETRTAVGFVRKICLEVGFAAMQAQRHICKRLDSGQESGVRPSEPP